MLVYSQKSVPPNISAGSVHLIPLNEIELSTNLDATFKYFQPILSNEKLLEQ